MHQTFFLILTIFCCFTFKNYAQKPEKIACQGKYDSIFQRNVHIIGKQMPEFPGGWSQLSQLFLENLKFTQPHTKLPDNRYYFLFIVEKDGWVKDLKVWGKNKEDLIKKGIVGIDQILAKMPRWKPGKCKGKTVAYRKLVPLVVCLR